MGKLIVCTINIGGLNDRAKIDRMSEALRALGLDGICQQETHLPWQKRSLNFVPGFTQVTCSSQTSNTRGVAIHVSNRLPRSNHKLSDKWGRWAIAVIPTLGTLCTIYGSNLDDADLLIELEVELASWPTPLIICGDFNIHMDSGGLGRVGIKAGNHEFFMQYRHWPQTMGW